MSKSASLWVAEGLRLEYVVTRRVLRLVGLHIPVEVSVDQLLALGVEVESPHFHYLFFGGSQVRGGSGDIRGVYRTEVDAKDAFHEYRQGGDDSVWGEVVKIDSKGRSQQVCWFGSHGIGETTGRRSRWRRR